jgi:hypothetical protein
MGKSSAACNVRRTPHIAHRERSEMDTERTTLSDDEILGSSLDDEPDTGDDSDGDGTDGDTTDDSDGDGDADADDA